MSVLRPELVFKGFNKEEKTSLKELLAQPLDYLKELRSNYPLVRQATEGAPEYVILSVPYLVKYPLESMVSAAMFWGVAAVLISSTKRLIASLDTPRQ